MRRPGTAARPYPLDEIGDLIVAGIEQHNEIVVADLVARRETCRAAGPWILVVENHRPAQQRFKFGYGGLGVDDLVAGVHRPVWLVRGYHECLVPSVRQELGHRRLDHRQVRGIVPHMRENREHDLEDLLL
jgi:hypothetical protein